MKLLVFIVSFCFAKNNNVFISSNTVFERSSFLIFTKMFWWNKYYFIGFVFGVSIFLIFSNLYTDSPSIRPYVENRRNFRKIHTIEYDKNVEGQLNVTNSKQSPPDQDIIFSNTRLQIQKSLAFYNFSYSGVKSLEDLPIETGGIPVRSLIISTWRSGTTFLGEILNALPGNYYHYEPLLKEGIRQIRGPPNSAGAIDLLRKMLKCNHSGMKDYFDYGSKHPNQFTHNTRLWDQCKYKKQLCLDADFTSKFCKLFPFQSMKVLRVRLHLIEELLLDDELNLKVLLLIRDPRGVMQSRQHRNFCRPAPDCWQPALLCDDMISDYVAAARLMEKYPDRIIVLRFEELALHPDPTVRALFKFLRLDMNPSVEEFIHSHTKEEHVGVSYTFRVSKNVPFKWKYKLDFNYVNNIQESCSEAMQLWGYKIAQNATHMTSKNFNPLEPYSIVV